MIVRSAQTRRGNSRTGSAVVAVIVALVVLQLAVVVIVLAGSRDQSTSATRMQAAQAQYSAEGVAAMAVRELTLGTDEDGDGGIGSIAAGAAADPVIRGAAARATVSTVGTVSTVSVSGDSGPAHRSLTLSVTRSSGSSSSSPGLYTELFVRSTALATLSDIPWNSTPTAVSIVPDATLASSSAARWNGGPATRYGIRMRGTIAIPAAGTWTFTTASDDGSALYINGTLVVNNDGLHSSQSRSGTIVLAAGSAAFDLRYFQNAGGSLLSATWAGPGVAAASIPESAFTCTPALQIPGLAASGTVSILGDNSAHSVYVDAFNSGIGPYGTGNVSSTSALVSTNSIAAGAMNLTDKGEIRGDAFVGPGGNPATVITTSKQGAVTGSSSPASTSYLAVIRGLPASLPATEGNVTISASTTINTNRRFTNLTIQNNSTVITVSGSRFIVCDGDLTISNQARIELASGASLTIYAAGNLTFAGDSRTGTNVGLPSLLQIFMSGTAKVLSVSDTAELCAKVRNPLGDLMVNGNKTSQFYGSFWGRNITAQSRSRVHLDMLNIDSVTTLSGWEIQP